jgi:hypothetical protein
MGPELVGLKANEWTCKRGIYGVSTSADLDLRTQPRDPPGSPARADVRQGQTFGWGRLVGVTWARRPWLRPAHAGRTSAAAERGPLTAPRGNRGAQNCR